MVVEDLLVGPDLLEPRLDPQAVFVDEGACALPAIDGPFVLEAAQCITHGGAAHAELVGELGLGRDTAILEPTLENPLPDMGFHLVGE